MFKSYEELKAEQERLAAIENNMWKLKNDKYTGWFKEDGKYSRTLSGTLPSQTEQTGTLELKEEWLKCLNIAELVGILTDLGFTKSLVLNLDGELIEGYEKSADDTKGWVAYKTDSGYTLYSWIMTNEYNGNTEVVNSYTLTNK